METEPSRKGSQEARILLVEDEAHLAVPLRFNLEQEGYEIRVTASGREALDLLRRETFDLIILDLMIEELDGLEVARQVRRPDERLPILMLTARSTEQDRVMGLKMGADDYMIKPFHLPELEAAQNTQGFPAEPSASGYARQPGWRLRPGARKKTENPPAI